MFESDSSLIFTGIGSIDEDPSQIMVGGNMMRYPQAETRSLPMTCSSAVQSDSGLVTITGSLETSDQVDTPFTLAFDLSQSANFKVNIEVPEAYSDDSPLNYLGMRYRSPLDEEIYGMGLQYTEWNLKLNEVELYSAEAGVGRGAQPLTDFTAITAPHTQGTTTSSYVTAP